MRGGEIVITKTTGWRWCIVAAIAFCLAVSLSVGGSSPIAHASPGCNGGAGAVCVWGANDHGQLGLGTTWDADVPIQMSGAATNGEVSLAAGGDHSLSLVQDPSSELTRVY